METWMYDYNNNDNNNNNNNNININNADICGPPVRPADSIYLYSNDISQSIASLASFASYTTVAAKRASSADIAFPTLHHPPSPSKVEIVVTDIGAKAWEESSSSRNSNSNSNSNSNRGSSSSNNSSDISDRYTIT